jgi:hypothetical protein
MAYRSRVNLLGAEPAGYLLLGFRGAHVPFGLVGGRRDPQVGGEAEDVVVPVAQAFEQVAAGLLLAAGGALDLAEAEDDAVPERMDQGRGDLGRDGGQALAAGGVRGVDESLQGLADLDRPVLAGVGLGGVGQITLLARYRKYGSSACRWRVCENHPCNNGAVDESTKKGSPTDTVSTSSSQGTGDPVVGGDHSGKRSGSSARGRSKTTACSWSWRRSGSRVIERCA